ncbi:ABC transporter permease [Luteolibacter soli]|uniref:ABC transporter permease n=1 Tax=Luteolibacter soli TaxID=3135280 RepID=A0ABU9ATQ8_9BACT
MKAYFLRRLLLIPLTLLGITALVFAINRMAPGGPVERALAGLLGGEGGKRTRAQGQTSLSPSQVLEVEEKKNRDRSSMRAYGEWLGVVPRDKEKIGKEFPKDSNSVEIEVPGTTFVAKIVRNGDEAAIQSPEAAGADGAPKSSAEMDRETTELARWRVRLRSPEEQKQSWDKWMGGVSLSKLPEYRAILYRPGFDGLLQGSLGSSEKYQEPVGLMILDRLPVSLYFALMDVLIIYSVCLPLGILKAIKHRTWVDNASSVAIFAGYAVPGYALGALLVVIVGARLGWLPIRGFTGDDFATLSPADQVKDLAAHTAMPLACYLIGSFAFMTMLMKNNLMDNLSADYVRTATAKGVSYPRAVFHHAFRNSIIPIATTFGENLALVVAGSVLVERVFDIDGFGMLQFTAVIDRDEPVMLGVLFFAAALTAIGKIFSDLLVAFFDPRVSYK